MRSPTHPKVDHDYRIFFAFMTFIMLGMWLWTLADNPTLRGSWMVIPFTLLLILHIIAHWNVGCLIANRRRVVWYILAQSTLAFIIVHLSGNIGMIFALYMALIGETVGFLGMSRWSVLATIYYLALSFANFVLFKSEQSAPYWLLSSIPTAIFVGMYVALYNRQNEAREQAQALAAALETANQQLTEYAARVEDLTIVAERQRMARELHDTLSQGLAGLILQLEAADAHLASSHTEKVREILVHAMQQARATLADARRAIDDLRQPSLDHLDSILRLEMTRFEAATGIPCSYQADSIPPLSDAVKETVLRVVAEALTNIVHHAQARQVAVNLQANDQSLSVTVKDDGVGFDPAAIPSGHYGLLGIRERIRLVNGSLNIQSEHGTTLKIEIPL